MPNSCTGNFRKYKHRYLGYLQVVLGNLLVSGMDSCNEVNLAWLLLVVALLMWVGKLILEIRTLRSEIVGWDVRFGRLVERLNELEIYDHPEYVDYYAGGSDQASYDG